MITSSKLVHKYVGYCGFLVTEGDHFLDGLAQHTIAAIKVNYVTVNVGWCKTTHAECFLLSRETGQWFCDTLVIIQPLIPPFSQRDENEQEEWDTGIE